MADRSRTSQRQQMAPGTLAVFKAAGHQFGAPASLWGWFSRFGASVGSAQNPIAKSLRPECVERSSLLPPYGRFKFLSDPDTQGD